MEEKKVYIFGVGGVSPLGKPYDRFENRCGRMSGSLKNTFNA